MQRHAFTLLEVLLTIALLAIVLAFVYPNLGAERGRRSLVESADRLRSLVVMTHAQAMQDGIKYRIQFPGTPDPLDRYARREIEVPIQTLQPVVLRQGDPLSNPDWFTEFDAGWKSQKILQDGTRCVAVLSGRPRFDISASSPIAGPSVGEDEAEFVSLTLNPDGSADWVTFVLTDLPYDVELEDYHVANILNVIVDGRTGQTWIQRALRVEEVEVMNEKRASPILHIDFTSPDLITEDNILQIHIRQGGAQGGR
jgi:prepilin-type N-terminal cleavage/methylation domain-containing protein